MFDRQKIEAVLGRRFHSATHSEIAAATNAIMGLRDEWEEVSCERDLCQDADRCALAREADSGTEFRLMRRRARPIMPGKSAP